MNNGTGVPENTTSPGNAQAVFVKSILDVHNRERAAVNASGGVPALVWSDKLAADAKDWAEHLATIGETFHSTINDKNHGSENIISCCHTHGIGPGPITDRMYPRI